MLSNRTVISPLGIIFDPLWIASEIFNIVFDTVKLSVTSCGGDVRKFIAPGLKLCSLLLVLDLLLFRYIITLFFCGSNTEDRAPTLHHWNFAAIRGTHAGLFLILPVSFIHLAVSATP